MARPREFDESVALDAAIGCFWQHGFEATSMRELAVSMGLSAPSLYNTFGDKQALFTRALEHYLDRATRLRLRRLETTLAPKQAIFKFFEEIIEHSTCDKQRKGCFLVNSALEIAPHHRELGAVIAEWLGEVEAFFRRCITGAQRDGTAPQAIDAKDVARLFLGVLLGIRVLARSNPRPSLLEGVVRPALALLDPPARKERRRNA
jgi:TetR/AcrR family transcriptional regulator, transcriptional repressor for nem operon